MKNLEFGKTLCLLKTLLNELEDSELSTISQTLPKLIAKAYELLDRNEKEANDYIDYMVNYTMEKASKKGTLPPPFDTWEDSKKYD